MRRVQKKMARWNRPEKIYLSDGTIFSCLLPWLKWKYAGTPKMCRCVSEIRIAFIRIQISWLVGLGLPGVRRPELNLGLSRLGWAGWTVTCSLPCCARCWTHLQEIAREDQRHTSTVMSQLVVDPVMDPTQVRNCQLNMLQMTFGAGIVLLVMLPPATYGGVLVPAPCRYTCKRRSSWPKYFGAMPPVRETHMEFQGPGFSLAQPPVIQWLEDYFASFSVILPD